MSTVLSSDVAAITIGRNEGDRLLDCLASLQGKVSPIIYVDSGSTDGSIEAVRQSGAEVVELDLSIPFTAARARNAGLARLKEIDKHGVFVQFLDGDCQLVDGWIETAKQALESEADLAIVCGRRRERFPEATIWNEMVDREWDTPVGEARECGGDALMRRAALDQVGGYRETLIAGEEPEMCYRLRQKGWRVRRLDAEMTRHDVAIKRFSQWWQRTRRAGHAFAEAAALHGRGPEAFRVREVLRALVWGAAVPLVAVLSAVFLSPWGLLFLLLWPLQILRLLAKGYDRQEAFFLTLGKIPEAQGVIGFILGRLIGRRRKLIEYK